MPGTLSDLLLRVAKALVYATSKKKYENLLGRRPALLRTLKEIYGLNGGTFVVADSHARKLVLLQDGVDEADEYDVKLRIPIIEGPAKGTLARHLPRDAYNDLSHRLFQRHRERQGFGAYRGAMSFSHVPEFFSGLHPEGQNVEDWVYIHHSEIERLICCWRALWVGMERFGSTATLQELIDRLNSTTYPKVRPGVRRFTDEYFERLELEKSDLAEGWIGQLDHRPSWDGAVDPTREYRVWSAMRQQLDTVSRKTLYVETRVMELPGLRIDHRADLFRFLNECIQFFKREFSAKGSDTLEKCLGTLHSKALLPIPAYCYYCCVAGQPKDHLVLPILRSQSSPVQYFQDDDLKPHSVVVAFLAALDARRDKDRDSQRNRYNAQGHQEEWIVELQAILRALAARIVDSIFVTGLARTHRTTAKRRHRRVLLAARPKSTKCPPGTFVLGMFDSRVSFVSQQTRAFALVDALFEMHVVSKAATIGIIGGGVAGVTAASAALLRGSKKVKLFEPRDKFMDLQASASHRYLLPYVLDWPDPGSAEEIARIPVLSWEADYADTVIAQLRRKFGKVYGHYGPSGKRTLDWLNTRVASLRPAANGDKVLISHPPTFTIVDIAIVSTGFGEDRPLVARDATQPYWEPDSVHVIGHKKKRVLVSGSGDGALIDLARAALCLDPATPFQHGQAIDFLLEDKEFLVLARRMQAIDVKANAPQLAGHGRIDLFHEYRRTLGKTSEPLKKRFRARMRKDTEVWFNTTEPGIFRTDTAIVFRLVAFLLVESHIVRHHPFRLTEERIKQDAKGWYIKMPEGTNGADKNGYVFFDMLVLRHGPPAASKRLAEIGGLEEAYLGFEETRPLDLIAELDNDTFRRYAELAQHEGLSV